MGDNAEFEKLSTLEARLAVALDRIAVGLGEAAAAGTAAQQDPGLTSAEIEEMQARAQTAEARASDLRDRLAALEKQVSGAAESEALEAERDEALAQMRALQAAQVEWEQAVRQRDADIETLRADLAAAQAAQAAQPVIEAPDTATIDRLKAQIIDLEGKLAQIDAERAKALAAQEIADQARAASAEAAEMGALRAELQELRDVNGRLTETLDTLRAEGAGDPELWNGALSVELDALKAARASEAAELDRILADLDEATAGEGAHA